MRQCHSYTQKQKKFLAANIVGRSYKDITDLFNKKFKTNLSIKAVGSALKRLGLKNGIDNRYKKGFEPYNKRLKGIHLSPNTEFKKGSRPGNWKPVGSERISAEGYVEIKVSEPSKWRSKHKVIWEKYNYPIPKGYVVIFADQDKANFALNNLLLVSRSQLLVMNRYGFIQTGYADGTKAGVLLADIKQKISEHKKNMK